MTDTEDLIPFAIFGLYRDQTNPQIILATDHAHAKRQYHDQYPGLEGTTFHVKTLEEMTGETDD